MKTSEVIAAWAKILKGEQPSLSIEVTRECPLRCPGCYAYDNAHLGGGMTLRGLTDRTGKDLIDGVLECVDRFRPLHLSLVGGDPLVRYRELEVLVPQLIQRGIHVQIVTSAFRTLPAAWADIPHLNVVVSIDGLAPEHDVRRAPATYDRIIRHIAGQNITIHCTVTGQMMRRPGYLREFLEFWTPRAEIRKIWFSLFTPQVGDTMPEILDSGQRAQAIEDMLLLRKIFPKLDMPAGLIHQFSTPPRRPEECVFALTTRVLSADLKTRVLPCQFGGKPDCSSCGCIASMGLAAVAAHKLGGIVPVGAIFKASVRIGSARAKEIPSLSPAPPPVVDERLHVLTGTEPRV
ncbi:MAG TPA: radical SAM protein [Bryobacteraceae bacterium]|nr:radical SAM protein [Bryobacteraceae bacterium]